ncbi:transmembrane protein, putative [Medicago truncatula]|uniref:Transmembrane protein, putative n=1 Tax=Medicago truncatula TaxID=3880 RepID=A0A072TZN6_MEDTR|nr:transmembrane protein, putative [Medicago truncatula]
MIEVLLLFFNRSGPHLNLIILALSLTILMVVTGIAIEQYNVAEIIRGSRPLGNEREENEKNWFSVVSEHRDEILFSFIKLLQEKKKE